MYPDIMGITLDIISIPLSYNLWNISDLYSMAEENGKQPWEGIKCAEGKPKSNKWVQEGRAENVMLTWQSML